MNVPVKLAGFAAAAAIVFGAAWGVGVATGPIDEPATTPGEGSTPSHVHHTVPATSTGRSGAS